MLIQYLYFYLENQRLFFQLKRDAFSELGLEKTIFFWPQNRKNEG